MGKQAKCMTTQFLLGIPIGWLDNIKIRMSRWRYFQKHDYGQFR